MNTPGSRKWSARRIRSPSSAPLVKGEEGSIERTATVLSRSRSSFVSAASNVDLPTPGAVGQVLRGPPPPLRGGPLTFLRFARRHGMLKPGYLVLMARWVWLKLRWRGRLNTDGLCFICPGVKFEIGRGATVTLGRWSWIGHGCKIRT